MLPLESIFETDLCELNLYLGIFSVVDRVGKANRLGQLGRKTVLVSETANKVISAIVYKPYVFEFVPGSGQILRQLW
jgi:hypothetical protein